MRSQSLPAVIQASEERSDILAVATLGSHYFHSAIIALVSVALYGFFPEEVSVSDMIKLLCNLQVTEQKNYK